MSPRAGIAVFAAISAALIGSACVDSSAAQTPGEAGSVRQLIDGVRGANAVQCELILQAFNGWTSNVPDRDAQAWVVTQRLRQRVSDAADVAWLGEQVRGTDRCAARAAARLLGRSPAPDARAFLVGALGDANPQVRRLAAIGIGFRSDTTVNTRLVTLLSDGSAEVRAAAAWALGAVH